MHTDRLAAPGFKLLLSETTCHACQQKTPTCALWVPSVEVLGPDGEDLSSYGPGLLTNLEWVTPLLLQQLQEHAPWLRMWDAKPTSYLAHHCVHCDEIQGDWYVFGYGSGPYWPITPEDVAAFRCIDGAGPVEAEAKPSWSTWMEWVEGVMSKRGGAA